MALTDDLARGELYVETPGCLHIVVYKILPVIFFKCSGQGNKQRGAEGKELLQGIWLGDCYARL